MRQLQVTCSLSNQILKGEYGIFKNQLKGTIQSFTPGEWVLLTDERTQKLGQVNPFAQEGRPCAWIIGETTLFQTNEQTVVLHLLNKALAKRALFFDLEKDNFRLVYGGEDGLPGVVIDVYQNAVLIQVHSAGFDRHSNIMKDFLHQHFPGRTIALFPNLLAREKEGLPALAREAIPPVLTISEDKFRFEIPERNIQKIGYYFDHRTNRQRLRHWLKKINLPKDQALDLFCYVGTWGHYLLDGGCQQVTMVDQADMEGVINNNFALNGFSGRANFLRNDGFKALDDLAQQGRKFQVIVSDPPAFAKDQENKSSALAGYKKLHGKILKVMAENGILFIGSCTHYVALEELEQTVLEAARGLGRKLQLIDVGAQGPDHPLAGTKSKSSYLKGLFYIVE